MPLWSKYYCILETKTIFIGRDKNAGRTYSALVKLDHKEVFQFEVCSVYVQRAEREALNNCNEWIASPLVTAASWMSCPASSLRLLIIIRFNSEIISRNTLIPVLKFPRRKNLGFRLW